MLIRQCSWCRCLLVGEVRVPFRKRLNGPHITHGICRKCHARTLSEHQAIVAKNNPPAAAPVEEA